ncbi:MAG: pyrrolo-quinoline quinone [Nitrospinae bacterium CG11_big_fil_rev_8_21_14_0_20_56_8]|nr:MAG: pyrrolo-quinoline quinone [Nitrospinae bacterium CG11_big_fil_rev_8_21_14_0_20_56_8]
MSLPARPTSRRPGFAILVTLMVVSMSLGGCSSFKDWDPFGKKQKPLPGERISVLTNERSLSADVAPGEAKIILPAPSANKDWPMAGGYANHAMHHIAVRDNLSEVWSRDIGTGADDELRFVSPPVVGDGVVFALDTQSQLSAYDLKTGDNIWDSDLEPENDDEGHIGGGVAYERGRVFVATGFGVVFAVDAKNGKVLWQEKVGIPLRAAPTVRGGRVFIVTLDNNLIAFDARDGKTLWTHAGAQETAALLGGASPAVDNGIVVVPYSSGELFALKVDTGKVIWQENLVSIRRTDAVAALAQIRGRPVIDRGKVIAISHAGVMASIDLRTGRRLWSRDIGGTDSPWVAGDYIYTITNDNELICVSRTDGKVLWVIGLPQFENPKDHEDPIVWSGPILASDRLIVAGSDGEALALSPYDGHLIGVVEMPDGVSVTPIVADGTVIFLANDADLVAYR